MMSQIAEFAAITSSRPALVVGIRPKYRNRSLDLLRGAPMSWKSAVKDSGKGYYTLHTQEIGSVPVRLFLTPNLLDQVEESIYPQIVNAASFPGVKLVAITPDVHHGYGVPIGTVLLTYTERGAGSMGPVGFDIGCFTGDTPVPTLGGPRTLLELAA